MANAGSPRLQRTRDTQAVTKRTVNIGGMEVIMYDGVDIPPPKFRYVDIAEAMKPGEAIVVQRGIDRDRIAASIRKIYGPGAARSKQEGEQIRIWRVK